ncbi:cob(I)yrinic acid a,c-diamide adenosyltransferase [Shouchella shacheensis]|uniref:cob(I)yrinic acid a,c-diamide adenosyltransferase n=1 Tax=Shouchella shacheensis TaxID=1649580 RepID=UPI0007401916|nr:cob(I)yrinic acid a,c-diamide adenosyltransferase [Shouchella shacheensis]
MNIYTRGGDKGTTSVMGARLSKSDARIEAIGAIDELNSFVGQAIVLLKEAGCEELKEELVVISHQLFDYGADLASVTEEAECKIVTNYTEALERRIDAHSEQVPPLRRFVLPGGSKPACALHVCRTSARRAEREVNRLANEESLQPALLIYINRLSDYFFAAARAANHLLGVSDVDYVGKKEFT